VKAGTLQKRRKGVGDGGIVIGEEEGGTVEGHDY
jgi:hypothetical protein